MDLYEAHRDHRDKFEIIAFHDQSAKSFAELDEKLKNVRATYWHGKDLPFPIILDATGKTIEAYGVHAFPTTILIDPEGKLVGHAGETELEAKLPPLPLSERIARALDRSVSYGFDDPPLKAFTEAMTRRMRVDIRLDEASLKAAGITPETKLPLKMAGLVSARSWLDLALAPYHLTVEPDDKGLVVTRQKGPVQPSAAQQATAKHLREVLDRKVTFNFRDEPLEEVARALEQQTRENFVIDPIARTEGAINLKTKLTGAAKDQPLGSALQQLLEPAALLVVIRDEVFVIVARRDKPAQR
jgi:hypothetical protein